MLETEFKYYLDHQNELIREYDGRYLVIVGENVVGDYPSFADALAGAQNSYALGTFLIQRCSEGEKDYTSKYHSRVKIPHAGVYC